MTDTRMTPTNDAPVTVEQAIDAEVARIMAMSDDEIMREADADDAAWARAFKLGLAAGKSAALASAPAGPAWRCFHCGDVFTEERCARLHFGRDEDSEPACVIKAGAEQGLLGALREAEYAAADARHAIADESTDAAKAYYAQATRHDAALRNAEEAGYERGLADGRTLASAPAGDGLDVLHQSAAKYAAICDKLADQTPVAGEPDSLWWERQAALREAGVLLAALARPRAAVGIEVECVETVPLLHPFDDSETPPIWRIVIDGYCADFETEQAARNFAAAIERVNGPRAAVGEREA